MQLVRGKIVLQRFFVKPKWIDIILGSIFLVVALIFSLPGFVSPYDFFLLQLVVPFVFPAYCFAIIILPILFRVRYVFSLLILVLYLIFNVGDLRRNLGINLTGTIKGNEALTVLSYNVSFFKSRQFNPYHQVDSADIARSTSIQSTIIEQSPDIICLQEYYEDENIDAYQLNQRLDSSYNYFFMTRPSYEKGRSGGLAIFSRYPILDKGVVLIDSTNSYNGVAYADILYDQDTVRIINVHLHSMQIRLDRLLKPGGIMNILRSYKRGSIIRQKQVEEIVEFIVDSPNRSIVLTGDMNELSKSYNYSRISRILNDAFVKRGVGLGYTLNKTKWALFRIDYQFYSDQVRPVKFDVLRKNRISEHFPVLVSYEVR